MQQSRFTLYLLLTLLWFGGLVAAAPPADKTVADWRAAFRGFSITKMVDRESSPEMHKFYRSLLTSGSSDAGLLSEEDEALLRQHLASLGAELRTIFSTFGSAAPEILNKNRDKIIPIFFKIGIIMVDVVKKDTKAIPAHALMLGADVTLFISAVSPDLAQQWGLLDQSTDRAKVSFSECFRLVVNIAAEEVKNKINSYKEKFLRIFKGSPLI